MSRARVLAHLVRADFLERVRRYSFLLTLGFALYLGYLAAAGDILLKLGNYRGIFNSAWIGALMTLVTTCFLTLAGFYIVKNTVERDRETGVGQILAATPLSKLLYTLGKTLSNFLVLASMVALLLPVAVVMQLTRGEETRIDVWALLSPFLLIAIPAVLFVAAIAVLFETIPGLRGGFGNVLYFFLWSASPALGIATQRSTFDLWGILTVWQSASAVLHAGFPDYKEGFTFSLNVGNLEASAQHTFYWRGVHWTGPLLLGRLFWMVVALGLVFLAAAFFDRFDPSRRRRAKENKESPEEMVAEVRPAVVTVPPHLAALPAGSGHFHFPQMVAAELRLMLKGQRWWWYAVAAGLFVACLASPRDVARGILFPIAWIWPVLLWSAMGTRETRCRTNQLVFSAAHSLRRQLPALWLAGLIVAALTGGGIAIRLIIAGDLRGVLGWLIGACFIPSMALACGTWSGSSKLFEILYTLLWYVGPMHATRQLDFMAASPLSVAVGMTRYFFLSALALAALALLGRRRQLQT
jgi:hypothetical protein